MVTAAFDTSRLVALERDGVQCETCCGAGGFAPEDCCCFLEPEIEGACGNENWNAFPPFGGPGKTPAFYTVTVLLTFPGGEFSWHSDSIPIGVPGGQEANCAWTTDPFTDGQGVSFVIGSEIIAGVCPPPTPPEEWFFEWSKLSTGGGCTDDFGAQVGDISAFISFVPCVGGGTLDDCPISGRKDVAHGDFAGVCIRRLIDLGGPPVYETGTGIISWRPGQIPEWDSGDPYFIGDQVAHEGIFYQCTADNTNQEPPNALFWVVI